MTPEAFRKMALGFPEATEGEHMGHPDFRVGGRIFATLFGAGEGCGMVKVPPREQAELVREHPGVFEPCNGAWGRQGCTAVKLEAARAAVVRPAMESAWRAAAERKGKG